MEPTQPSRRDFLSGKAAQDALEQIRSQLPQPEVELPPPSPLVEIGRKAMACDFHVYLNIADRRQTDCAVAALDLVDRLEDQLSVYREESELSRINRLAFERTMPVERRLFDLLKLARQLHSETAGAFDITSGPISKLWGFYRRAGRVPDADEIDAILQRVGNEHVQFIDETRSVRFTRPGMEFNLGGIGKGYALDRCVELLTEQGVESFLIHGGQSSIIGRGSRAGLPEGEAGWSVALRHPLRDEIRLGEVWLRDNALGSSGSAHQFFYYQGKRFSHILDPRTARPAEGLLSTTVVAPTGALADALATAFFVMGLEATRAYCDAHPQIGAVVVAQGARASALEIHTLGNLENIWRPYA